MNSFRLRVENCKTTIDVFDSINPKAGAQNPKTVVLRTLFGARIRVLTPIHYDWSWDVSTGEAQGVDSNDVIYEDKEPTLIKDWWFPNLHFYFSSFSDIMPEYRSGINYVVSPTPFSPNTWIRVGSKYILNANFIPLYSEGRWKKIDDTPNFETNLKEKIISVSPYGGSIRFGNVEKNYYARLEENTTVVMTPTVFGTYEFDRDIVTTIRLSTPPTVETVDTRRSLYALSGEYATGKLRVKIEPIFEN